VIVIATTPPDLPSFAAVRAGWPTSEARLRARDGRVLDVVRADASVRRLDWVPLGDVAAPFATAAVAAEDRRFFVHHGVDWQSVGGALRDRVDGRHGRGASTITMQLAGLLSERVGGSRSWLDKIAQARAAVALERTWTKAQILEAWVNLLPFRGDLVGIDAAARSLAGKPPAALDATEARVLISLLPAPRASPARVARRACATSTIPCARLQLRTAEMLGPRAPLPDPGLAPQVAARLLTTGRRDVRSTLDAGLQTFVADILREQLASLAGRNARDGAAIVVDNASGDILAYVGSGGDGSRSGAVDGARAPRQAGSSLKPFLYELAIERRLLTAASVLDDAPVDLDTASGLYIPQNYDRSFRGPVSVRSALGNSLNIPAVRTLILVGVDAFRDRLFDVGYRGISRDGNYYGFSLALGSAEVTLVEQAAAFRALARRGLWSPLRLEPGPATLDRRVMDPAASAIVTDILADPAARSATFGPDNGLELPFRAAVKTGTSKALRDNWCIGFTARFTVAVWVGNFEGDAMGAGVSGVVGAAPAWRAIMLHLSRDSAGIPVDRVAPFAGPVAGIVVGNVRYIPAIEPPRSDLFLPGTALSVIRVAATQLRPWIVAPADGTVVALDPDIPAARQRIAVVVTGGGRIAIDGRPLASPFLWLPMPGYHHITLAENGHIVDSARLTVR
jgi:penicillin-binding protein 1C